MRTYFIHTGSVELGPFTLDELRSQNILKTTSVWTEGSDEWKPASQYPELQPLFSSPPPFKGNKALDANINDKYVIQDAPKKKRRNFLWLPVVVLISIVLIFVVAAEENPQVVPVEFYSEPLKTKSPEELKLELLSRERLNALKYLTVEAEWNRNLIGEIVIKGRIMNSATLAHYKDVVLEVQWLTRTKAKLNSEIVTIYDFVGPGSSVNYKIKNFPPSGTREISVEVRSATPAN